MKKIVIICPHPKGVAPGQRLKYEQYFESWRKNGYEVDIKPFMSYRFWNIVYKRGYFLEKIFWTCLSYLKRIKLIFSLKKNMTSLTYSYGLHLLVVLFLKDYIVRFQKCNL